MRCFLKKELFTSASQNKYSKKFSKSHWKTAVMELCFSEIPVCNLTKIGLPHSFFRVNFVKFFKSAFSKTYSSQNVCSF